MSEKKNKEKKQKTTKQKVIRGILIALLVVLIIAAILITTLYFIFKHYYDKTNYLTDEDIQATAMSSEQIQSEIQDIKDNELIDPVASSIYESMKETAEPTLGLEEESSISESVKESISLSEGDEIFKTTFEAMIDERVNEYILLNPGVTYEEAYALITSNAEIMNEIENKAREEADKIIESKAADALEELESSIAESAAASLEESLSSAAEESAIQIVESMESELESQSKALENIEINDSANTYNLLLIGVDYHNYSDTIMLVTINSAKNTIYMTSILRDMGVSSGMGMMKLNNTYRFGGAPLLVKTIQDTLKVRIDNYAFVTFPGMWQIFDAAGGLDMSINDAEVKVANDYIREMAYVYGFDVNPYLFATSGYQHMNGIQILGYCRVRYVGMGDFDRTGRQREALTNLFNKLKGQGVGALNDFLNKALPVVSHNIPSGKVMELMMGAPSYIGYNLVGLRIPIDGSYSLSPANGMVISDFAANAAYLNSAIN